MHTTPYEPSFDPTAYHITSTVHTTSHEPSNHPTDHYDMPTSQTVSHSSPSTPSESATLHHHIINTAGEESPPHSTCSLL